jgi:hypothetical protein
MNLRRSFLLLAALWFAAATLWYVYSSIDTVIRFAPHALYADQWDEYLGYLSRPFPANILQPRNGHRAVLPNLVAWIEIQWLAGNQWLQIAVGILSGLGASAAAAWTCLRDREVPPVYRAAALFLCFFAIFWLANVRTLFHSDELIHTKLPMLCLMLALALCIHATRTMRGLPALVGALALGFAATFSFGYGLSVFLGAFAVLIARKADRSQLIICGAGLLLAAGLYLGAPGSAGVTATIHLAPLEDLILAARWLGAPFVTMFGYLWNPDSTGLVTNPTAHRLVVRIADIAARNRIDLHVSVMPQALIGVLGMLSLVAASLRRLLARDAAAPMEAIGLGIAWFGLGGAGIVSLGRLGYFQEHPDQIYAERYLCWPCLFWLGLALVGLSRAARKCPGSAEGARRRSLSGIAILAFVLPLPLLAWPTQYGGGIYAALVRGRIDNMAAASIVGVFDRKEDMGETISEDYVRGIPALAERRIVQFADPVASMIGQPLPAAEGPIDGATIETRMVAANLLGEPGTAVVLRTAQGSPAPDRFLLTDADCRIVGLVVRDARLQPPGYSGYARGVHAPEELKAAVAP